MTDKLSVEQQKLVEDRVGLATAIGHNEWKKLSGYERDDIISLALQGLVVAASRWPSYCERNSYEMYTETAQSWFNTYATYSIRGAILDGLRSSDVATRAERATVKKIRAAGVDLYSPWEREAPSTVAAATGIPLPDVLRAISALLRVPTSVDTSDEIFDMPSGISVEREMVARDLCQQVVSAIESLPPLHQRVLLMSRHYGMSDRDIVRALPELRRDPVAGQHALAWVRFWREQARCAIVSVLKAALVEEQEDNSVAC